MRHFFWFSLVLIAACSAPVRDSEQVNVTVTKTTEPVAVQSPAIEKASAYNDQIHSESTRQRTDSAVKEAALRFAHDISENNEDVLLRVREAFDNPNRDPTIVGLDLREDTSDFEIAFRMTITALNENNYVLAYEKKHANELLSSMVTNEAIFPVGADLNPQIEQYIEQLSYGIELGPDDFELDEPIFAEAVNALEKNANANGVYFLELNLGSGNTRYIIPTSLNNYERWLNIAFQQELAVERLSWATIWDDIAYNIYDTDSYDLPGILEYHKPRYRDARSLVNP